MTQEQLNKYPKVKQRFEEWYEHTKLNPNYERTFPFFFQGVDIIYENFFKLPKEMQFGVWDRFFDEHNYEGFVDCSWESSLISGYYYSVVYDKADVLPEHIIFNTRQQAINACQIKQCEILEGML